jgi:hypothetical protein
VVAAAVLYDVAENGEEVLEGSSLSGKLGRVPAGETAGASFR